MKNLVFSIILLSFSALVDAGDQIPAPLSSIEITATLPQPYGKCEITLALAAKDGFSPYRIESLSLQTEAGKSIALPKASFSDLVFSFPPTLSAGFQSPGSEIYIYLDGSLETKGKLNVSYVLAGGKLIKRRSLKEGDEKWSSVSY
ncbi:MAG: hypothetical protein IPH91_05185 [Elusimicrobia bacterium]|nr:hypothetical protein [Elusimicrobiota bacterium]MBK8651151.1 hypothetical protein [Elusimicrobiota bacterium]